MIIVLSKCKLAELLKINKIARKAMRVKIMYTDFGKECLTSTS